MGKVLLVALQIILLIPMFLLQCIVWFSYQVYRFYKWVWMEK